MRLLVTALAVAALVLAGCSHDKQLNESPEQVAKEQSAADTHNAGTVPSPGDDESASTEVVATTTTQVEYEGVKVLRVGDCVDIPRFNVPSVRAIPCGQPHHAEVTARVELGLRFGFGYPNPDQFEQVRVNDCTRAFEAYVGHGATDEIAAGQLEPSTKGWYDGDRTVTCVAEPPGNKEGNVLTRSVRKPA